MIDNLKAGVIQADWFDPELNPKLLEFCHLLRDCPHADQARECPGTRARSSAASTTSRITL